MNNIGREFVRGTVKHLIGWISSMQRQDGGKILLFHYMDEVKGCGLTVEKKL